MTTANTRKKEPLQFNKIS